MLAVLSTVGEKSGVVIALRAGLANLSDSLWLIRPNS